MDAKYEGDTIMEYIYLVRHCEATGQDSTCTLTENGKMQAIELAEFFRTVPLNRIVCSPYKRAIESCKEIADAKNIHIEYEPRLRERVLCENELPDWKERLFHSFKDPDVKLAGGESSKEAAQRGVAVIKEVLDSEDTNTLIVTHGNLLTLILNDFDDSYGYETWSKLTNPDVYCLIKDQDHINIERVWNVNQ